MKRSLGCNKYRSKKHGIYDSRKESRRALVLKILEQLGQISQLREQVSFELIPAIYEEYTDDKGKRKRRCKARATHYIADFVYIDADGKQVVEDVKGYKTEIYKLKKKLMLWRHGIEIMET